MTPLKTLFLALTLAWNAAVAGQPIPPADLPPTDKVVDVLNGLPAVRAAQAALRGAQAEQRQLQAGDYEYTLGLNAQRRNVSDASDSNEWAVSLERGLRLPGKATLDEQIGMQLVEEAEEKVGDARHESARQLLSLWYSALRAQSETTLWKLQADTLAEEHLIVQKRLKRGDAARIDQLRADAALAQARSQARQAEARSQAALSELRLRFPSLPVPAATAAEPLVPDGGEADWIGHTLEHNHELLAVRKATERARLTSKRAEQDRTPDPVLGVHYGTENRGDDRILGVSLSIPLAGQGRAAKAAMQLAQAEALHEMESATRLRLSVEAAANWQAALSNVDTYTRLKEAAEAMDRHASLAKRAHELGELGLSETLLGHRNALEARIAVEQARLGANEAVARLLLDAHQLWPLGGEHHRP